MTNNTMSSSLITSVADLDEKTSLEHVQQRLANGHDPLSIVSDCQLGLQIVGERYEQREYYLAGLIMAGEIFREVMNLLQPSIEQQIRGNETGSILLGTVQGDIHNIGKNNLSMLLRCYGFVVHDLGVNISPDEFVEQAQIMRPDIVALSGLLSMSRDAMHETVKKLRSLPDPQVSSLPVMIGGGLLNQEICDYVGADYWATSAMDGVRLCQRLFGSQSAGMPEQPSTK